MQRTNTGGEVPARISPKVGLAYRRALCRRRARPLRHARFIAAAERAAAATGGRLDLRTCAVHLFGHGRGGRQARAFGAARSGRRHSQEPHGVRPRRRARRRDPAGQGAAAGTVSRLAVRLRGDQLAGQSPQRAGRLRDRDRRPGEGARPGLPRRRGANPTAEQWRRHHAASADPAHRQGPGAGRARGAFGAALRRSADQRARFRARSRGCRKTAPRTAAPSPSICWGKAAARSASAMWSPRRCGRRPIGWCCRRMAPPRGCKAGPWWRI